MTKAEQHAQRMQEVKALRDRQREALDAAMPATLPTVLSIPAIADSRAGSIDFWMTDDGFPVVNGGIIRPTDVPAVIAWLQDNFVTHVSVEESVEAEPAAPAKGKKK